MDEDKIASFKEKLESQHSFPCTYTFKFIVPAEKVEVVKALFDKNSEVVEKTSSKGSYKSVTARIEVQSSDQVIVKYIEAKNIEGIISL